MIIKLNELSGVNVDLTPTKEFNYIFNPEIRETLLAESQQRIRAEQKSRKIKDSRSYWHIMTKLPLTAEIAEEFNAYEDVYGKSNVRSGVEAMRLQKPGYQWTKKGFFGYLRAVLNNKRAEHTPNRTAEDDYIDKISKVARKNTTVLLARASMRGV